MKTSSRTRTETVTLARENLYFGGMHLAYRLIAKHESMMCRFFISVTKSNESCEVDVGGTISVALECFESAVRGAITPCALEGAMKDHLYLQKNNKSSLQTAFPVV